MAVLIDHETCLNYLGLRCDVCYRVCPLIDKAISSKLVRNPRTGKHAMFPPTGAQRSCTGCGKCEHACVLEEAAIKVVPRQLAKGSWVITTGSAGKRRRRRASPHRRQAHPLPTRKPEGL